MDMIGNKSKSEQAAQSIRVEIYNQTYNIRSDGDNEYIMRLAEYVDGKMREISSGTLTVDSLKVAILAALHIADEFHQLKSAAGTNRRAARLAQRRMRRNARPRSQTRDAAPQEFETEQ